MHIICTRDFNSRYPWVISTHFHCTISVFRSCSKCHSYPVGSHFLWTNNEGNKLSEKVSQWTLKLSSVYVLRISSAFTSSFAVLSDARDRSTLSLVRSLRKCNLHCLHWALCFFLALACSAKSSVSRPLSSETTTLLLHL